jgi:hypothetical protein
VVGVGVDGVVAVGVPSSEGVSRRRCMYDHVRWRIVLLYCVWAGAAARLRLPSCEGWVVVVGFWFGGGDVAHRPAICASVGLVDVILEVGVRCWSADGFAVLRWGREVLAGLTSVLA